MGTITTTAQPDKGRVRIDLDWTSHPGPSCLVYRVPVGGTATLIRDGNPCILSNNKATIYDWEGPLDTPTYYQSSTVLNRNGSMETGVEEWQSASTTGGTALQSTDYFYAGSASLQFTPTGSAAAPTVLSEEFGVTVGVSYTANAQVLGAKTHGGGIGLVVSWYTSGHALISTSGTASNLWPAVGLWEPYTLTATAPATAAFGRVGLLMAGTPLADKVFYLDEAYVSTPLSTINTIASAVTLPSSQGGWWKDPLHPATMLRVQDQETAYRSVASCGTFQGVALVGVSRPNRPADAAELAVPSQSVGVGSFAPRKSARRTAIVASGSYADADAVRELHSSGSPLLIQLPAKYGLPDGQYWLCGDLQSSALGGDLTRPFQVHSVDMVHNQLPPGPAEGVLGTRYTDLKVKGARLTFSAAVSAGYTWLDALKGNIQ